MRRTTGATLASTAALLLLVGCGAAAASTLPEDDQAFCAEQEGELGLARDQLEELIDGDRHWSSDGEPFALREVYIVPARDFASAFHPQDQALAGHVDDASSSLFMVGNALIGSDDEVFAQDAQLLREATADLDALQQFCDENG